MDQNRVGSTLDVLDAAVERGDVVSVKEILKHDGIGAHTGPVTLTAARIGHKEILQLMLTAGADPYWMGQRNGRTAVSHEAENGHREVVKTASSKGCRSGFEGHKWLHTTFLGRK
ncbi:hypothetical protein BX600DRAFT_439322 [Xylariales sp. PMI_506]|nr:hypothetical protein BX600DRAFT_439322 [Xylariales sp. PMI_506]